MRNILLAVAVVLAVPSCASTPKSASEQHTLTNKAQATLTEMKQKAPGLENTLQSAYAYAVFPDVGKGAFIVGGAGGAGVLFQGGVPIGNVKISKASFGASVGAESMAELVILNDQNQVNQLKSGSFDLGANVQAIVLTTGGAAPTGTVRGTQVFIMPRGGAMVDVSVAGQRISFEPLAG
jgi:lipid-binding SYLF domain-containing protein